MRCDVSKDEMNHEVDDWADDAWGGGDDSQWPMDEDQTEEPTDDVDGIDPELIAEVESITVPLWREAIAEHVATGGKCEMVEFPVGSSGILARLGRGAGLGRYMDRKQEDGATKRYWAAWTRWVGYRARQKTTYTIGPDYRLSQVGIITHTIVLLDRHGRQWFGHDVPSETSASSRLVDLVSADLEVPFPPIQKHAIGNMFRLLGSEEIEVVVEVASTGWCLGLTNEHPTRPTFLAPFGSVTSDGVTDAHRVGAPVGSTGELSGIMSMVGFGGIGDVPPDQTIAAVEMFHAITPGRLDIPVALLGALWSSPLGLPSRPVVMVEGKTDCGKTLICTAVMAFTAAVKPGAKDAASMSFRSTTEAGARSRLAWHRDMVVVADDYRRDEADRRTNEQSDAILALITQSGYGAPTAAKSTQTGGTRAVPDIRATVIISAEVVAHDPAIRNRTVVVHVGLEDGITVRGGGFDRFRDEAADLPRALMADYLKWLCERVEVHADKPGGGLAYMMSTATADARDWHSTHSRHRAAETVSGLAAGWMMFRRYAKSRGLLDHLPSAGEVEAALVDLADAQDAGASEADPGTKILDTIRDAVASAQGHLLTPNNGQPAGRNAYGWVAEVSRGGANGETERWIPKGSPLGILTDTRRYVLLTRAHIQAAAKLARMTGLRPEQIHRALDPYHDGETEPGTRCASKLAPLRPKGWVIPAHLLGVELAPGEELDVGPSEPVEY